MKKKTAATNLEWLVEFSQVDLVEISPGEKAKLLIEANEILVPRNKIANLGTRLRKGSTVGTVLRPKFLKSLGWVDKIPSPNTDSFWELLVGLQKLILAEVKGLLSGEITSKVLGLGIISFSPNKQTGRYQVSTLPVTDTIEGFVITNFYKSFHAYPISSLKECLSCRKIFVEISLREKYYCSPQCHWRHSQQKRRSILAKQILVSRTKGLKSRAEEE
jgi:hypothetical protein